MTNYGQQQSITATATTDAQCATSEPLALPNLLNTFADLAPLLAGELQKHAPLNSYLLAAGMNQILEDYLNPCPRLLSGLPEYVAKLCLPFSQSAVGAARWLAAIAAYLLGVRRRTRRLQTWQAQCSAFVQELADETLSPHVSASRHTELLAGADTLLRDVEKLPAGLLREVIRIPSCFRSFDQRPADVDRIVRDFAQRWPDHNRALVVVGVRTSGSYLAPLCAASLKACGYTRVRFLTVRPGVRLSGAARATLRSVARDGGVALLSDDPPATGESLADSAEELVLAGFPPEAIVLFLQLFESRAALPDSLRGYSASLLPWPEWTVHEQFEPRAIQRALAEVLGTGYVVGSVHQAPSLSRGSARGHIRAVYRVSLTNRETGDVGERWVSVEGAGLGYFGEHGLAIARQLAPYVPEVLGVRDGLVYRAWLPEAHRLIEPAPGDEGGIAEGITAYVLERRRAFAIDEDVSLRLAGRLPAWEAASNLLCRVFGRGWPLARPLVDPHVRRLLRAQRPSVVDGRMALCDWLIGSDRDRALFKADGGEGVFSNRNLSCFDPVYSLAGLAASCVGEAFPQRIRRTYERTSGERIGEERWLLHQLVHLWDAQRDQCGEYSDPLRASARAVQRYIGAIFFADVTPAPSGGLCALDVDGVLETEPMGFPVISPAGALVLRALTRHGFRPVLVTGRSLDEVRDRCHAYRLAGGVAEYGAVAYNHLSGQVKELLSAADRADLARLRAELGTLEGVKIDATYRYAVRAYRIDGAGRRQGLRPGTIAQALALSGLGHRIRTINGEGQTDFMVILVDKGNGLLALAEDLGQDVVAAGTKAASFAVGDTLADLPMLALAARAFAPAHADSRLRRAGVTFVRRPYQSGLALSARHIIGHAPGACPTCALPRQTSETRLLLTLLSAPEAGLGSMLRSALSLSVAGLAWPRPSENAPRPGR